MAGFALCPSEGGVAASPLRSLKSVKPGTAALGMQSEAFRILRESRVGGHLGRGSPFHQIFELVSRDVIVKRLEKPSTALKDFHTETWRVRDFGTKNLAFIQKTDQALARTKSHWRVDTVWMSRVSRASQKAAPESVQNTFQE